MYPTEDDLQRIRDWPWQDGFRSLMAFVRERWEYADVGYWTQQGDHFAISTGGWSGNESLIGALEDNYMFMALCAESWETGGHYVYDVREWGEGPDGKKVLVVDPASPTGRHDYPDWNRLQDRLRRYVSEPTGRPS